MPAPTFTQARDALLQARNRFVDQAMLRMYPSLDGHARTRVLLREQQRSEIYAQRMQNRLHSGMRGIGLDPGLLADERDERVRSLVNTERRYLAQHIAAVSWRLAREAELHRLKAAGETEGFWLLDNSKHTHTPDCLAAAGKVHAMDWLERYGPQTRHTGCGCRTISVAEAGRRGFPLIRGRSPAVAVMMHEAENVDEGLDELFEVRLPVRPGVHGGDPYHGAHGRFVSVRGEFHRSLRPHVEPYFRAIRENNGRAMERHYEAMRRKASRIPTQATRERQLRLLASVHAAALNPEGAQVPYGTRVRVGEHELPVPLSVPEHEGLDRGWHNRGRFAWLVAPHALGTQTDAALQRLKAGRRFEVRDTPAGTILRTHPKLSPRESHSAAIALERQLPQLRRSRIRKEGEALGDDTPLDLRRDLSVDYEDPRLYSRHRRVTRGQVADAGELMVPDIALRLKELGVTPHGRHRSFGLESGDHHGALDAQVGDLGAEIKTTSLRAMVAGRRAGTISTEDRARKLGEAHARGLAPALIHPIIDFDNGVGHVFAHVYDDGQGFKERRLPAAMLQELLDGKLTPGDERFPDGASRAKAHPWTYVGTFALRYNPLDLRDQGLELRSADGRLRRREIDARLGERTRTVEAPAAKRARTRGRSSRDERDRRIVELAQAGGHTQGDIADELGVSQATVSNVLREQGIHMGRGTRSDLRRGRS